jgi:hypothetical protein
MYVCMYVCMYVYIYISPCLYIAFYTSGGLAQCDQSKSFLSKWFFAW